MLYFIACYVLTISQNAPDHKGLLDAIEARNTFNRKLLANRVYDYHVVYGAMRNRSQGGGWIGVSGQECRLDLTCVFSGIR